MRKFLAPLAISALAMVASVQPSSAEIVYPWCAQYGSTGGGKNCGFESFAQCRATILGTGGFCERNVYYDLAGPQPPPRKPRAPY